MPSYGSISIWSWLQAPVSVGLVILLLAFRMEPKSKPSCQELHEAPITAIVRPPRPIIPNSEGPRRIEKFPSGASSVSVLSEVRLSDGIIQSNQLEPLESHVHLPSTPTLSAASSTHAPLMGQAEEILGSGWLVCIRSPNHRAIFRVVSLPMIHASPHLMGTSLSVSRL